MNDSLDQIVSVPATEVNSLVGKMEDLITEAVASNDPLIVFREISILRQGVQIGGVMVAKLLSDMWDKWPSLKGVDVSFNGFVEAASVETGLKARTIKPYIRMWKAVFGNKQIPANVRPALLNLPVGTLLYLQPSAQDGTLDGKWKEIVDCETPGEVKEKVRALRGSHTSSETSVRILLAHDGRLKARRGTKGTYKPVGFLDVNSEDEVTKIAINRIISAAGIVELD